MPFGSNAASASDVRTSREIRSLTGIRGIAALVVVLYHIDIAHANVGLFQHVLHHGYLSVDLFFVLSGFVMALTYGHLFKTERKLNYFPYFIKNRVARIYPLYLISTLLCLILALTTGEMGRMLTPFLEEISGNLLMIQSWGVSPSINGDAWSISTEWLAYLIFPILISVTVFGRAWQAAAVACCAIAILAAMSFAPDFILWRDPQLRQGPLDRVDPFSIAPILRCICEFMIGLLTFRAASSAMVRGAAYSPTVTIIVCGALLILLAAPGADLPIVLLFPALILILSTDRGPLADLIGSAPVHRLGVLSYAIYLTHPLILWPGESLIKRGFIAAHMPFPGVAALATAMLAIFAVAQLAHSFIEQPARRAIRLWADAKPRVLSA